MGSTWSHAIRVWALLGAHAIKDRDTEFNQMSLTSIPSSALSSRRAAAASDRGICFCSFARGHFTDQQRVPHPSVLRVRVLTSILYSPWKAPFPTAGISKKPTARNRRSSLPRDHPLLRAVIRLARRSERPRDLLFLSCSRTPHRISRRLPHPSVLRVRVLTSIPSSSKWGTRAGASKHRANKQPTVIPTEVAAFLLFLASRSRDTPPHSGGIPQPVLPSS